MIKIVKYFTISLINVSIFIFCFAVGYFVIINGEIRQNIIQATKFEDKNQYGKAYEKLISLRGNTKTVWAQKQIDEKIAQLNHQALQEWDTIKKQYEVEESEVVREKVILFIDRYDYSSYYTQAKKFLDNMNAYDDNKEQMRQLQEKENDLLHQIANLQGLKDVLNQNNVQIAEKEFQKISIDFMKDDIFSETELLQIIHLMKKKDENVQLKENPLYMFQLIQALFEDKEENAEYESAISNISKMIEDKMSHNQEKLRQILMQQEKVEKQLEIIQRQMLGSTSTSQ